MATCNAWLRSALSHWTVLLSRRRSRVRLKALLVFVVCSVSGLQGQVAHRRYVVQSACSGTAITTSDDVGALAAAGSVGQTFCMAAGTHRLRSVTPKQDQKFIGVPGAVMSGAKLLTSPSGSGPWTYASQTQHNTEQGTCRAAEPMCQNPEDLWIDDVLQHHVATIGEVTVGSATWFFNYSTDVITIGTNPSGHTVETSVTDAAFISEGGVVTGVVVQGLTIEKYATLGGKGTISAPNGQFWIVRNNVFRSNHSTAVGLGDNGQVLNNYLHHNGQNGVGAYDASNLIITGNEASYNGQFFDPFWGAGGMKVAFIDNSTIAANYVHNNFGPGIWCDIDCKTVSIYGNTVNDNDQSGIFYEISFDALIYSNIVRRNGFNAGAGPAQAGILIAESKNVAVYSNTVEDNAFGIYAYQEARGTSPAYGVTWVVQDLNVHDNTVKTSGRIGLEQTESDTSYFTSKNNHFEANTYTLAGATTHFTWNDANNQSFTTWQGFGHDSPVGSASTYGAPALMTSGKGLNSGSTTTATTGSLDTTGSTGLYCSCSQYLGGGTSGNSVCTDSKSNSWTLVDEKADDTAYGKIRTYYVNSATPTVGSGHTFTCTGTATYPLVMAAAFSGTTTSPLDQHVVSQGGTTSQASLSGITPTQSAEVVLSFLMLGDPAVSGFSVNEGMTIAQSESFASGQMGGVIAYKVQGTAALINPTISWSTGSTVAAAITTSSFKAEP